MLRKRKPLYWRVSGPGEIPPTEITSTGTKIWRDAVGLPHRDGGLPAVERVNGEREWYVHGQRHRDGDLPAIELANGHRAWWVNGERHRAGGEPAVLHWNGSKEWWLRGEFVRRTAASRFKSDTDPA